MEAENRQEATVTIWMRPDGGLEREVVEEFESGSLQAFQAAVTGRGTQEGRIKQISKIKGFGGVKFPETGKIRQEQNEGRKVKSSSVLTLTGDRVHKGPTVPLSSMWPYLEKGTLQMRLSQEF